MQQVINELKANKVHHLIIKQFQDKNDYSDLGYWQEKATTKTFTEESKRLVVEYIESLKPVENQTISLSQLSAMNSELNNIEDIDDEEENDENIKDNIYEKYTYYDDNGHKITKVKGLKANRVIGNKKIKTVEEKDKPNTLLRVNERKLNSDSYWLELEIEQYLKGCQVDYIVDNQKGYSSDRDTLKLYLLQSRKFEQVKQAGYKYFKVFATRIESRKGSNGHNGKSTTRPNLEKGGKIVQFYRKALPIFGQVFQVFTGYNRHDASLISLEKISYKVGKLNNPEKNIQLSAKRKATRDKKKDSVKVQWNNSGIIINTVCTVHKKLRTYIVRLLTDSLVIAEKDNNSNIEYKLGSLGLFEKIENSSYFYQAKTALIISDEKISTKVTGYLSKRNLDINDKRDFDLAKKHFRNLHSIESMANNLIKVNYIDQDRSYNNHLEIKSFMMIKSTKVKVSISTPNLSHNLEIIFKKLPISADIFSNKIMIAEIGSKLTKLLSEQLLSIDGLESKFCNLKGKTIKNKFRLADKLLLDKMLTDGLKNGNYLIKFNSYLDRDILLHYIFNNIEVANILFSKDSMKDILSGRVATMNQVEKITIQSPLINKVANHLNQVGILHYIHID